MGPPPPPNGCFSTAIIRVLQEPAEIRPFVVLGGTWGQFAQAGSCCSYAGCAGGTRRGWRYRCSRAVPCHRAVQPCHAPMPCCATRRAAVHCRAAVPCHRATPSSRATATPLRDAAMQRRAARCRAAVPCRAAAPRSPPAWRRAAPVSRSRPRFLWPLGLARAGLPSGEEAAQEAGSPPGALPGVQAGHRRGHHWLWGAFALLALGRFAGGWPPDFPSIWVFPGPPVPAPCVPMTPVSPGSHVT